MQSVPRLVTQFIPSNYNLSLNLNRAARSFSGLVAITGILKSNDGTLRLHAKELSITSVNVDGKTATFRMDDDELVITHPDLTPGKHIVTVSFMGTITDEMHGLYPCYFEHNGVKKELLATQFESHHAREVFPCIDEPEAKATFDLTLSTEPGVTVLGNMPIKFQRNEDGQLITTFKTTPRMSTYLLAWVAGELHRKTATTKGGVEVNVWATFAQRPESLDFALAFAVKTVDFFDDYFGTPYPLPKCDHVALPDFSAGAMENWGLITYREAALLADPETAGISSKQHVATVVAHELSHQWFGNLVTMKWWNDLWLNESFATLMEYIAVEAIHPEWNIWLEFSSTETILSLRRDSLEGVQSVQVDVHHPDEIGTLFDSAIVYAKGARLLRMLQHYVGEEAFRQGLRTYFKAHAYNNTEADDLWNVLSQASSKDVSHFMQAWISQPGFPLVTVNPDGSQLSQSQFFVGKHRPSDREWPIPLNSLQRALPPVLNGPTLQLTRPVSPFRLNIGDTAHFLTHYPATFVQAILFDLTAGKLSPIDRLQFLHEQTMLAQGRVIRAADLIPLIQAYAHETEEPVWNIISLTIGELKKFVEDDVEAKQALRNLSKTIARHQYNRLGWKMQPDETENDTKLRATIMSLMLYGKDESAVKEALNQFAASRLDALDPELRALIIGAAVRDASDTALIEKLLRDYKTTPSPELKNDIASGLTSSEDAKHFAFILPLLTDKKTIRPQDTKRWYTWLVHNPYARTQAWAWLQSNWEWVTKTYGNSMDHDVFPRVTGQALSTRQQLQQYRDFFSPFAAEPALSRAIQLGAADIEGRVERIEHDAAGVCEALRQLK